MTSEEFEEGRKLLIAKWRENIENCLSATDADFIVASGESVLTSVSMAAGYPIAAAPLGFAEFNGRPFGIEIMARDGEEGKLFQFMSAWEASIPDAVKPPPLLSPVTKFYTHSEL